MSTLRLARHEEAVAIVGLEDDAARVFVAVEGYDWVPGLPSMAIEDVERGIAEESVWVVELEGTIVGAAVCFWHGADCHLRELNVHPHHARQGLGRRLVEAVVKGARAHGCSRVALTTFSEVPFNGPWYERMGFRLLQHPDGWLADERAEEGRIGLDRQPRQAMVRTIA